MNLFINQVVFRYVTSVNDGQNWQRYNYWKYDNSSEKFNSYGFTQWFGLKVKYNLH